MAQLTINVPEDQLQRVIDAFAATYGYQDEVPAEPPPPDPNAPPPEGPAPPPASPVPSMVPNPETRRAFTKRILMEHVLSVVRGYEVSQASAIAQKAAALKVADELILT